MTSETIGIDSEPLLLAKLLEYKEELKTCILSVC